MYTVHLGIKNPLNTKYVCWFLLIYIVISSEYSVNWWWGLLCHVYWLRFVTVCDYGRFATNLSCYTSYNSLHQHSTEYVRWAGDIINEKELTHMFCTYSFLTYLSQYYLLIEIIILVWSLYSTFVQERPGPEIIFTFMCTIRIRTTAWCWPGR
jgi:hypothetical protein